MSHVDEDRTPARGNGPVPTIPSLPQQSSSPGGEVTEAKGGGRFGWLSPTRGAIAGALLLGTLPMWTLPLMAAGSWGFLAYLSLSHAYYGGARRVFGATLFPAQEFGIIPNGVAGLAVATALYAVLGALIGWAVGSAVRKRRVAADSERR